MPSQFVITNSPASLFLDPPPFFSLIIFSSFTANQVDIKEERTPPFRPMSSDTCKMRVLCLHGRGTNANVRRYFFSPASSYSVSIRDPDQSTDDPPGPSYPACPDHLRNRKDEGPRLSIHRRSFCRITISRHCGSVRRPFLRFLRPGTDLCSASLDS